MCGIGLCINCELSEIGLKCLNRRGPDFNSRKVVEINSQTLNLYGSVLSHQGNGVTEQPKISKNGNLFLLWNGEIYHHAEFDHSISDTEWLMKR